MESLKRQAARILREQKKYKLWLVSFLCLAVLVTAGTVAALTMSGQALNRKEKVLTCKLEAHQHTEQCRDSEGELTCGQADYVVHVHNDDCYGEDGALVCALPEKEPHVHDAACFEEQETLVCTQEESAGHQHGPECYTKVKGELTCSADEAAHQHGPECYTKVQGELTCGQDGAGHQHGPECYTKVQGGLTCTNTEEGHAHTDECYAWNEELTCGQTEEAHVHTDDCYAWSEELTCGQTEEAHVHTDDCYAWSEELTCQIPEGEGAHTHTDQCYETETVTICGELELHTHDKAGCYDKDGNLTCGQTELLEHVHGEGCFEIIEPDEEGTEAAESGEAPENKEASGEAEESTEALESEEEEGDAEPEDGEATEDGEEAEPEDGEATGDSEDAETEDADASEETEADEELQGVANVLTAEGSDYTVTATYGEDAGIPEGAVLSVREILQGTEEYDSYYQQMLEAIAGEGDEASTEEGTDAAQEDADTEDGIEVSFVRFFDITFLVDGEKIEPVPGAAVDIRISYKDAVECGEDATASAVHFAKDGTEVLDAAVTEAGEGSDFAFTQDSFSVTSTVVATKAPKKKTTKTLTTTAGDVSFTITGESEESFLKSDRLIVNEIKDNGGDAGSGNNRYRKYLNNSEGAIKKKNNQQDKEMEVFSARVFEISVVDSAERKKQTGNVKVEIQYNNAVKAQKAGSAVMVLNSEDSGEVLSSQAVSEGQEVVAFSGMQTFSASAPNVVTAMVASAAPLAEEPGSGTSGSGSGTHTSVAGYLTSSAANDWQIVDQGYAGNGPLNKTKSDDKVRIQKNVIPTEVENEFYVYLSVDTKEVYEKVTEQAIFKARRQKVNDRPGTIINPLNSQFTDVSTEPIYTNHATFTVKDIEGNILFEDFTLYWSDAQNITLYMIIDDKNWLLLASGAKNDIKGGTIIMDQKATTTIKEKLSAPVKLETVEDVLGNNIEYLGMLGGDYYNVAEPEIGSLGGTLTWKPATNLDVKAQEESNETIGGGLGGTTETKVSWYKNVAQLAYKVRLHVTQDKSCAEHIENPGSECKADGHQFKVNENATLTYDGGSIVFPEPLVRGVLYDIKLQKQAKDKNDTDLGGLPGATFSATDAYGNSYEVTSGAGGEVSFTGLPCGTYTVTEKAAPNDEYEKDETWSQEFKLCYTEDKNKGVLIPNGNDMIRKDNNENIPTIYNTKMLKVKFVKEWDSNIEEDNQLDKVIFVVNYTYRDITKDADGNVVKGTDGKPVYETKNGSKEVTLNKGSWSGTIFLPSTAEITSVTEKKADSDGTNLLDQFEVMAPEQTDGVVVKGEAVFTPAAGEEPDTYTITNQYKKYPVKIIKIDKQSEEPLSGAMFDLYDEEPGEGITAIEDGLESDDNGVIFEGKLKSGDYWLVETNEPNGYVKLDAPQKFTVTESQNELEVKVENELAEQPVKILKVDAEETNDHLEGAVFSVEKKKDNSDQYEPYEPGTWTSDASGVLFEGKLPVGTYRLTETQSPAGYNLLANPVVIEIAAEKVKKDNAEVTMEGDSYIIKISNNRGAILPETGGMGTKQFTIGGMMLVTAVAFLMYGYSMRRRKSERRSKQ